MPSRIEDYGLIGDCETAALVAKDGSIDWLCWPRFDSGACFAALLGSPDHGRWQLSPAATVTSVTRRYRKGTLILETEFSTEQGVVTLIDFMPVREKHPDLIRFVRGDRGKVSMQMELILRFDYGRSVPWVMRMDDGSLRAIAGPNMVTLRTPVPLRGENMKTVSEFTVNQGETIPFVLTYRASHHPPPHAIDPHLALDRTEAFWKEWIKHSSYQGPWAEVIERSLITLKALTYRPTGGIVAAPTTSLPEKLGGQRNWDYRFCWLRDATFTLWALLNSGFTSEAGDWQNWLLRAVAGSPDQVQIMYGLGGERQLTELELGWLPGYEGSKPVRIGNAASEQLQLDIYGEIAGALYLARRADLPRNDSGIELQRMLLEHLEKIWREPDEGIWEVRGPRRHFTHSKVMAWLAFDCAIKSVEQFGMEGPVDQWRKVRQQIHEDVCANAFDPRRGTFVQSYGSKELDASLLLVTRTGFLPAGDPRIEGTVRAIERHLMRDGFVLRYDTHEVEDGLPPGEGVFLPCSFWLADNYLILGRHDEANRLFERLLALRNDVGLLSEEYDLATGRLVGNFPQAFSHMALVNTALKLTSISAPARHSPDLMGARSISSHRK